MFCENCGHQISDTAKFCSACGHPVGTAPSPGAIAPPAVPAKRESPRLKASSGNGSITRMSGTRRKPWLLRMPIPDPHTGITVMKAVGTYVTREEAEAVRAEMMKRPATPYQDSTLQDCFRMFKESREYKGRSDKARELYDIAWKYLHPLWHFKIAALYAQDFQNILDKMADNGLSQSMLEKERTLISKLYRTAIGWRVVDANLASVLKVEGRKSPEREIFTDEQVTLILSQKNTPTGQMVIALLACGVRIYELLHFKHEDFHRTESGAYLIGGCKTEAGRNRIIPILDFGIPVFEHAYATSVENGPLFPNGKGGFWNEKNWRNRKFYPFLEEIGIQPNPYDENGKRKPEFAGKLATYTPYTTRHTYASLCDRAGVNKDILKRAVGHTPKSKKLPIRENLSLMDGSFLFLFAQSVSGLIASFLFKIQRWNFLHQILHVTIQRTRKAKQRFCLCFVDVLLSLFVLLDGTHRHISLSCQFRLAQSGQCAHGFQVCFRLCRTVQLVHLVCKLPYIHLVVGRIQQPHRRDGHRLFNLRKAQTGQPLVIGKSPACPVFRAAVVGI